MKPFPPWKEFHNWPKAKEMDGSSVSSLYRIIPNDVLANNFFDFLNILIDDAESEQNSTGSSTAQRSSGQASSSQQSTYEPARGSSGNNISQEFQPPQEFQKTESNCPTTPSGESAHVGSEPGEQTLEGVKQPAFSPGSTRSRSTHKRSLSASSSISSLSSTSERPTTTTSRTQGTPRHTDLQQEGLGVSQALLPAGSSLPATTTATTVAVGISTSPAVVSIQVGNPQQLIQDAITSSGQPRHTPAVGPLGQTLTKK